MTTHRFRGRSMQDAVGQLKAVLGPDAVIVNTRRGEDESGRYVEIEARPAPGDEVEPARGGRAGASAAYARVAPSKPEERPFAERASWLARQVKESVPPEVKAPEVKAPEPAPEELGQLKSELMALRQAVESLKPRRPAEDLQSGLAALRADLSELRSWVRPANVPDRAGQIARRLVAIGLSKAQADEAASRAQRRLGESVELDGVMAQRNLAQLLADGIECSGDLLPKPGQRRVLAFVGPTGVGKTTTIAKIAARARLLSGVPVALLTVDTFRLAAVDQLARYAEILECPLQVVKRPEELPDALKAVGDARLVLVDSTGRNPRAADQVASLGRFFTPGFGGEVVLTLAASTREADLAVACEAFEVLNPDLLCMTKLDETSAVGSIYSVARSTGRPLAWVTDGQRVPEDLEVADRDTLAGRFAKGLAEAAQLLARAG